MSTRAKAVGAWLLLVGAAAIYLATRLAIDADFSAFLPRGISPAQRVFVEQLQRGAAGRLVLIGLEGDDAPALAALSRALATKLDQDPAFTYINNGSDDFKQRQLASIASLRYVLSDRIEPGHFSAANLRASLDERLEGLAGSAGMFEKSLLGADPTSETMHLLQRLAPFKQPHQIDGVWFDASGTRALLVAETRAPGSDLDQQKHVFATLQNAFASVRGASPATMRYSSPGAMAIESRALIASDVTRLSLLSTALIGAILVWVYRSLPVVLLCAMPALSGILFGVVAVNLWFGSVHAIALGFGATLLGEAVDYPSYLLTQTAADETIGATVARMLPMLRLAVATTACGALPLLMADFPGLAQLGLMTLVGVIVAGVVTVLVLPTIVPATWRAKHAAPPPSAAAASLLSVGVLRRSSRVTGIVLALLIAIAVGAVWSKTWWDDDLANMNPLPATVRETDRQLRDALGAPDPGSLLALSAATQDEALAKAEQLRPTLAAWQAAGDIGGFDLVSDYLPSAATQAARRAALPSTERLRTDLAVALTGLPFRPEIFEPFVRAVDASRQGAPLALADFGGTALGLKAAALLNQSGGRWTLIVPLAGVKSADLLAARVAAMPGAAVQWISVRTEAASMLATYRRQTLMYTGVGVIAIYAVLGFGLRDWRRASRVLLPAAGALLLTATALVAAGGPLTIFHLVALLLTLGIGINYALFIDGAVIRREPPPRIARTLAVVAGTTLCAFGALALSRTPVLHAIGATVCLGVLFSLLLSALLLSSRAQPARAA